MRVTQPREHPHDPAPDWERRRHLAAVFGDVLPETTSDERDPDDAHHDGVRRGDDPGEEWLRAQVPPHHG